jgi:integrase
MRRGEILSLQWEQIRNGFIYLTKTKTNEARQIPVNGTLVKIFAEIRKEQPVGTRSVFLFAKGEHTLKGAEPVRPRKGPAPLPEEVNSIKTAYN